MVVGFPVNSGRTQIHEKCYLRWQSRTFTERRRPAAQCLHASWRGSGSYQHHGSCLQETVWDIVDRVSGATGKRPR
jgi:hypothetical protein